MSVAEAGGATGPDDGPYALPRPVATLVLLALIALLFAGEILLPVEPWRGLAEPSISTLVAWGGMSGTLVLERGEWFRILTAALLHGGYLHIAFNSYALYIAGRLLEPLIGWPWLLALYVLGAAGGGIASIHLNAPNIVGIGASGAIMGLFGFILTISLRFPGEIRRMFIGNGLSVLLPSILPAALPALTGGEGLTIDYAAHAGGAVAGAVLGLLMVGLWRRDARRPPLRPLALAITAAGVGIVLYGATVLIAQFPEHRFAGHLIPETTLKKLDLGNMAVVTGLIAQHPDDPRGYLARAQILARQGQGAAADAQAALALERAERFPRVFTDVYRVSVRAYRAGLQLDLGQREAARATAAPICTAEAPAAALAALRTARLCP